MDEPSAVPARFRSTSGPLGSLVGSMPGLRQRLAEERAQELLEGDFGPIVRMVARNAGIVDRYAGQTMMTRGQFTRLHDLDDHPLADVLYAAYVEGWQQRD